MTSTTNTNLIEYLKTVDTPTLCNAIELLGVRPRHEGYAPLQLRCLFPELGRLCGYAITAQVETVTRTEPLDRQMFLNLYRAVAEAPKPAVVVFQDVGGYSDFAAAQCGEVIASITQRLGAIGLVSDGAVRDLPEVRALGFHYFARGVVASHGNLRIVRVGAPVNILGLPVRSGDLLHGDVNNLTLIPEEGREQIETMVERVRERERKLLAFVRSPEFSLEGMTQFYSD